MWFNKLLNEAAEEISKRNLYIVNLQGKIKHLELENTNLVRFLQNLSHAQNPNQANNNNHEADHVEFSTIQDPHFSVASSLNPADLEKLNRINQLKAVKEEDSGEKSDQNCLIQDFSKCSYKIDESVLKRLS